MTTSDCFWKRWENGHASGKLGFFGLLCAGIYGFSTSAGAVESLYKGAAVSINVGSDAVLRMIHLRSRRETGLHPAQYGGTSCSCASRASSAPSELEELLAQGWQILG